MEIYNNLTHLKSIETIMQNTIHYDVAWKIFVALSQF